MNRQQISNASEYKRKYYKDTKTQKEMILEYMELYGSITPQEALRAIGSMRLGARIWDLRHKDNISIVEIPTGKEGYATYRLA